MMVLLSAGLNKAVFRTTYMSTPYPTTVDNLEGWTESVGHAPDCLSHVAVIVLNPVGCIVPYRLLHVPTQLLPQ
jgi:hypothetical protein